LIKAGAAVLLAAAVAPAFAAGKGGVIKGTDEADRLVGTRYVDVIQGRAGDDRLEGRGGEDLLFGGEGRDRLDGGARSDLLNGGPGGDLLVGGGGPDRFVASGRYEPSPCRVGRLRCADIVVGGPGNDVIGMHDRHYDIVRSCGEGRDEVIADPSDDVADDCEVVRRR
jgi:hypothetical protein